MASTPEDRAKVLSTFNLVRDGNDVDAITGEQIANAYSCKRLAAFVKNAPLSDFPPTVSPVLAELLKDLSEAQIWGTTEAAATTARTAALLPRDGSNNVLATALAVRIWDSWEGLDKERQRARATVAYLLNTLMPLAITAWTAVYPSALLLTLRTQLQAITGAQVQASWLAQEGGHSDAAAMRFMVAVCSFATTAARAAEGEMRAIEHVVGPIASATKDMPGIRDLTRALRDEIRATRPANGLPAQAGAAVQAARLAARNRLLTGIATLVDL